MMIAEMWQYVDLEPLEKLHGMIKKTRERIP